MTENEILKDMIAQLKKVGVIKGNSDIAEKMGYNRKETVSENINKSPLDLNFLSKFCAIYNIPIENIRPGVQQIKENNILSNSIILDNPTSIKKVKGLPVWESYSATLSNIESYRDEKQIEPDFYLNIPQYRDCDFATRAKGDSMHPVIRNMALVGGKRIYDFSVIVFGDIYIIHTKNGIETIKYIHPHETDPDQILLVLYNGNAKTTPVHKSEILRIYQAAFVLNPL